MTIYIESFLVQNILINLCLLRLVFLTTKTPTNNFRLFISSIIGAGFSVFVAIFLNNNFLINLLKFICALVMMKIAFKSTIKSFIFNFILFFLYTYALFGTVSTLTSNSYLTNFGMILTSKYSLEIITFSVLIFTYVFELVTKHIKPKIKHNSLIVPTTLYYNNNSVKIQSYIDTGNLLEYKLQPVIIVDINTFLKLTKMNIIDFYLKSFETINTGTVNGNNNLKLFKIDTIKIQQGKKSIKFDNQYIAINSSGIFTNQNYQALLSPNYF